MKGLVVALLTMAAATAHAAGWTWHAPDGCPDEHAFHQAVTSRLDRSLAELPLSVDVSITMEPSGFTARLTVHGAIDDARELTSDTCSELADAIAVVVARLASTLPEPQAPAPAPIIVQPEAPRTAWNGGLRLSSLFGTGSAPGFGIAGELGAWVSRGSWELAISGSRWKANSAMLEGTMSGVDVAVQAVVVRAGWRQRGGPIRTWVVAELGSIRGEGIGLMNDRTGSSRWSAAGAGGGYALPLTRRIAVLASAELEFVLDRTQFRVDSGTAVYRTPAFAFHGGLAIEAGWR